MNLRRFTVRVLVVFNTGFTSYDAYVWVKGEKINIPYKLYNKQLKQEIYLLCFAYKSSGHLDCPITEQPLF